MRKPWIIGAIAVVVIGVAAYVLSQPKEGTVEWHKGRLEYEMNRVSGERTLFDKVRNAAGYPQRQSRYKEHHDALLAAGYLQRRDFVLTNSPEKPSGKLARWAAKEVPGDRLWSIEFVVSNSTVVVCAERHSMKKWEQAVRRIDVPESGK